MFVRPSLSRRKAAGMSSAIATSVVSLAVASGWKSEDELSVQAFVKDMRVPVECSNATSRKPAIEAREGSRSRATRSNVFGRTQLRS